MNRNGEVIETYKVSERTDWVRFVVGALISVFLMILVSIFLAYWLFDKETAQTVYLIIAGVIGVLLLISVVVGIAYAFARLMAKGINEHVRVDGSVDAQKMGVVMDGVTQIAQANAMQGRNEVKAQEIGFRISQEVQREARRVATENQIAPINPADFLRELLGDDDETNLLTAESEARK